MQEHLVLLRQIFTEQFNEEELRTFCFDLGIDYDDLPGRGKPAKARELVAYLERHQRITDCIRIGKQSRPDILWEQVQQARKERKSHDVAQWQEQAPGATQSGTSVSSSWLWVAGVVGGLALISCVVLAIALVSKFIPLAPDPTETPTATSTHSPTPTPTATPYTDRNGNSSTIGHRDF